DPAGGLEMSGGDRVGDRAHELRPDTAGAGAVEVDEVDTASAELREAAGEGDRVPCPLDHVLVGALMEPDGALAEHVDSPAHADGGAPLDRPASGEPLFPLC